MVRVKMQKKSAKIKLKRFKTRNKSKTKRDVKQCSPHNKENSFSCFDKKAIIRMISSWNKHYRKNKIMYNRNETQSKL